MSTPAASLVAWASCWLGGRCAPDDVIDALSSWAGAHAVVDCDAAARRVGDAEVADDLPGEGAAEVVRLPDSVPIALERDLSGHGISTLLAVLRSVCGPGLQARLVLPVPGDMVGLPAHPRFRAEALSAGEAVLLGTPGEAGLGLIPRREGPDVVVWNVHRIRMPHASSSGTGLGEVEYALRDAVRTSAEALARVNTGTGVLGDPGRAVRQDVTDRLATMSAHRWPVDMSERAERILETADRVAAILAVAAERSAEAVSAGGAQLREQSMRPLEAVVRHARVDTLAHAAAALLAERD